MKTYFYPAVACAVLLMTSPCAVISAEGQSSGTSEVPSRHDAVLVSVTASVEAIDLAKRELTLKGPLGNHVTFVVDQRVKRLDEVKVGDLVSADYYISVAAELRKPTAEEEKHPLVILDAAGKAEADAPPAAAGARRIKVVTTVEGLDRPTETITVKGPRGNYYTTKVKDPARLTQMRIGDNIVVTFTEALAISLEKVEKKKAE